MTIAADPISTDIVNEIRADVVELREGSSRAAHSLAGLKQSTASLAPIASTLAPRATDDEINRFLLCVLASKSAKEIKEKAQDAGERLLITTIVNRVLTSYREAEKEAPGLLSGPGLRLGSLYRLNVKVLNEQINGCARDRVRDSQVRLERATRLGDEARIKVEKEALARDVAECERIVSKFR